MMLSVPHAKDAQRPCKHSKTMDRDCGPLRTPSSLLLHRSGRDHRSSHAAVFCMAEVAEQQGPALLTARHMALVLQQQSAIRHPAAASE